MATPYDIALKVLLRQPARHVLEMLIGGTISALLNPELPQIVNRRADLLAETPDGRLVQIEIQATNDRKMPLRMAEYAIGILRQHGRLPEQTVLYVGEKALRMDDSLRGKNLWFRYNVVDAHTFDGEALLRSPDLGDKLIAILGRWRNHKKAIREIQCWRGPQRGCAARPAYARASMGAPRSPCRPVRRRGRAEFAFRGQRDRRKNAIRPICNSRYWPDCEN